MSIFITKADGTHEAFNPVKLEQSLERAGASSTVRARVLSSMTRELKEHMTTEEIYRKAFDLLRREEDTPVAARYSVKRAVFALGPSGFPFEQFLSEVLRAHGWSTRTDQMLTGRCAPHEVDVVAQKAGHIVGIEAKFHNDPGQKTDIKDVLYVHARYEDLKQAPLSSSRVDEGWLVTNTSFTKNAIRYARCSNLTIIGWDYPRSRGLVRMIEEARVHPLTCLTTLSESEKRRLLENKIVLCKSVQIPETLRAHGIPGEKVARVQEEANRLCGI
jgi:hypothetical protein